MRRIGARGACRPGGAAVGAGGNGGANGAGGGGGRCWRRRLPYRFVEHVVLAAKLVETLPRHQKEEPISLAGWLLCCQSRFHPSTWCEAVSIECHSLWLVYHATVKLYSFQSLFQLKSWLILLSIDEFDFENRKTFDERVTEIFYWSKPIWRWNRFHRTRKQE